MGIKWSFSSRDSESKEEGFIKGVTECSWMIDDGLGGRSWFFGVSNLNKSNPQSFVTSHQKENKELMTTAKNLFRN